MVRSGQFTLASLLIATALIAAGCALLRFMVTTQEPLGQFYAALAVPIVLCGAVGILRGRFRPWLHYGVAVDGALMLLAAVLMALSTIMSAFGW